MNAMYSVEQNCSEVDVESNLWRICVASAFASVKCCLVVMWHVLCVALWVRVWLCAICHPQPFLADCVLRAQRVCASHGGLARGIVVTASDKCCAI